MEQHGKTASKAKFIKLGAKGGWEDLCLSDGTARIAFYDADHEDALNGNRDALETAFKNAERSGRTASDFARQVLDFYHSPPETIWITFSLGKLWWCRLAGPVEFLGSEAALHPDGSRLRRTVGGWSDVSLAGKQLLMSELNGNLTAVSQFQGTICDVQATDYLLRKIYDEPVPEVVEAMEAREACLTTIQNLLALLPWYDFEVLIDLVFARSGWRRTGALGGTQKTVDIELEMPVTSERAFVQVKSRTNQREFDRYLGDHRHRAESRFFFVYHTSAIEIASDNATVTVIGPQRLSEMILSAGLFDWLIARVG